MNSRSSNEPETSRRWINPDERLYPRADAETLSAWASEVHEFLDDAEQSRSAPESLEPTDSQCNEEGQ